jgi:AhpD family alkylhydroperoxidase
MSVISSGGFMKTRMNFYPQFSDAFAKLGEIDALLAKSSIDHKLLHLMKIRASQINGCTFCIDMHSKEAKIGGEKELRLYHLAAWEHSPLFSDKEKAALMWTESVTNVNQKHISDELYGKVHEQFTDKEMVEMTMAIGMINTWNRFAISFRSVPGTLDKAYGLEKAGL